MAGPLLFGPGKRRGYWIFSLKKLPSILGSSEFIQTMKERFFAAKVSAEVPEAKMLSPISIESIKAVVSTYYGVKESDPYAIRRGFTNESRNVAVYLARTLRGENLQEIAKQFQIKSYSTSGSVVGCVKTRIQEDGAFVRSLARIREMLEIGQRNICPLAPSPTTALASNGVCSQP